MQVEDEEEEDLNVKRGKKNTQQRTANLRPAGNTNPIWQKKFGRTSVNYNIYGIPDIDDSQCGTSNEWFTPQSSANCAVCVLVMALIALILMIFALAIGINDWDLQWGNTVCTTEDNESYVVSDKINFAQAWEYYCIVVLMISVLTLCAALFSTVRDRRYIVDKDGNVKKNDVDVDDWSISATRFCCRCQILFWLLLLSLLFIWFWMTVDLVNNLNQIGNAKNCAPSDDVMQAAQDKVLAFAVLIVFAVLSGILCGLPFACIAFCKKSDE